jgi:hypothetical protein
MMLNTKKCVFVVSSGKLLGYMVSFWGIDANPKKVEAIKKLQPPQTKKEIQKLAVMLAALSRFISKLGEHGMSFYRLLRKADDFQWDDQATTAFVELKQYLKSLPTLVPRSLMTFCYYMWRLPTLWSAQSLPLNDQKL